MFTTNTFIFFSALEQFDLMVLFGPLIGGFNNMVLTALFIFGFCLLSGISERDVYSNNRTIFASFLFFTFIRKLLSENLTMEKDIYFYYTAALFGFVFFMNVLGLIPFSLNVTSYISVTFMLSCSSFLGNLIIGIRTHSWRFFGFFIPAGAPMVLAPMLFVIELISYFARLFSLAIRLFANMMAGHALLKILSSFVYVFFEANFCYNVFPVLLNFVVLAVTFLEFMIAFLQTYVFVVLSTIYTNEAIHLH